MSGQNSANLKDLWCCKCRNREIVEKFGATSNKTVREMIDRMNDQTVTYAFAESNMFPCVLVGGLEVLQMVVKLYPNEVTSV